MKTRQQGKKPYTIKEKNGRFQVFDKDSKFRQDFATRSQAETFAEALTSRTRASHAPAAAGLL